jgi:hypothetical protein
MASRRLRAETWSPFDCDLRASRLDLRGVLGVLLVRNGVHERYLRRILTLAFCFLHCTSTPSHTRCNTLVSPLASSTVLSFARVRDNCRVIIGALTEDKYNKNLKSEQGLGQDPFG